MATFVWACFDGGGNVPPSIGIGRELVRRGHDVRFAGRPEMAPRVQSAGMRAHVLPSSYRHADQFGWHPRGRLFSYLTSPAVGQDVLDLRRDLRADVLVVDAMFGAALDVTPDSDVPTAVMLHTFLHRTVDGWEVLMGGQAEARERSGLGTMPDLRTLWGRPDVLHVNSLAELDSAPSSPWPTAGHGAPVLEPDARARVVRTDRRDDRPLVLVSFSTAVAQSSVGKLQSTLDALADLPVRGVATIGAVDPDRLRVPASVLAVPFADHGELLRDADLVVTHGGHGTAMRALSHGVPLVCLTGRAADQEGVAALDQPRVAAFVEERGAGLSLPADAPVGQVRDAIRRVLADRAYRDAAEVVAVPLRATDGATLAADRLEGLLAA
ncbi:glycosyltransferase [Cellulomonas sp. Leaf334]|uniref:glycosyltransferase n=1 Tax=Cellulomonas sp. Leaf334 TaxID=1736339 RepID=UPI0006FAD4CD|nr:nucleotide disphospho-sugar-binding domain-containing protein [Cellulomonas sp. Leaf334]KQR17343.1 hypothetical protein ASF78_08655 [Cellulomonas sp. Leaf334]